MESISKRTGKHFTGKFADTALKIGIASEGENLEGNEQGESPALPPKVAKKVVKKVTAKKGKAVDMTEENITKKVNVKAQLNTKKVKK